MFNCAIQVDRHALSREFTFHRHCDEIQKAQDIEELREMAITLLRLNRVMRETVSALAKQEIPITAHLKPRQL